MSGPAGWAFVDVETTGLNAAWDRVVSVSVLTFTPGGQLDGELHTLVDPQRDPGPVHIHGLTPDALRGAPLFHELAPRVRDLTAGRVLVAHNAQFDYKFLHAETERCSMVLPTTHRLCTIALTRRLDLPVENHKLATVAAYWGVQQRAAHDARDDVRVLREVFEHSQAFARRLGVDLPVLSCIGRGAVVRPARIARVPSPYVNPKHWTPPARLVQGMKIVITGPTSRPRAQLAEALSARGLDVMNSVSSQTRLLVCNEPSLVSGKHEKARNLGVPVLTEAQLVALLDDVEPGTVRGTQPKHAATIGAPAAPKRGAAGPWTGRTVLVLGGTADDAAHARERASELGARVLVNLGARTTHVITLDGAETDPRHAKVLQRQIATLTAADLAFVPSESADQDPSETAPTRDEATAKREAVATHPEADRSEGIGLTPSTGPGGGSPVVVVDTARVLQRGHVMDLPGSTRYSLAATWQVPIATSTTTDFAPFEVDVVAFALGADGLVGCEDDFVFYNQPSTPDGGVRLTVDGTSDQGVELDLEALPEGTEKVRIAAAIDGDATFGEVGAVHISLTDTESGAEVASATLDAATTEHTLVIAEVYERNDVWRFRAVGQGFEHGLAELATDHGIEVGS